ncbi:MAG: HAD-IC family P-type ATPase [Nitriliruptoraceae bacterium]
MTTDTTTSPAAPYWHAHEAVDVVYQLDSDIAVGLSQAEVEQRRTVHGANELPLEEVRTVWQLLAAQFTSPLIAILLVAMVVTALIGEYTDSVVIAVVLIINASIGYFQESRAERAVHALMELASPQAIVIRDSREQVVAARDLVPGDIVRLTSGDRVPADLRLVRTTTLDIDESMLTGESEPIRKSTDPVAESAIVADRFGMAYFGATVVSGRATGIAVATGLNTQLGKIADSIRTQARPTTPLQRRMKGFANRIAVVVLGATGITFAAGIALGESPSSMFLIAVALAVAVVPEGLPVALTVALALGVRRMSQRNVVIRALLAVETLGSTNVIGSDKTGTLTENRMTAVELWTADGTYTLRGDWFDVPPSDVAFIETLRSAAASSEAAIEVVDAEIAGRRGEATDVALLEAAYRHQIASAEPSRDPGLLALVPFESQRQYAYAIVDEDGPVLRAKGAPERLVGMASSSHRDVVLQAADDMARRGLRVLAMAQRKLDTTADEIDPVAPPEPSGLTVTGLIGLQDPPRDGVKESIDRCRDAQLRVIMITGDHAATAQAIAAELGIGADEPVACNGRELEEMSDEQLESVVGQIDVFARVTPEHKLRVVRALQAHGLVVAVTGDGVNDGPALKAADIGVAMGRSGTDVAREASDMVLTDDNFVSIAAAVEEGRVVFDNVRKVTYFLLSTGFAAIVAIVSAMAAGLPLPYVPAALLWLNVVTNGVQDVALAFDPGEPDVLQRPPRHRDEPIVPWLLWERAALCGTAMAVGSLWIYTWAIDAGYSQPVQRGAALTTLVVAMAVHAYNARSERRSILRTGIVGNRLLLASTIAALLIHLTAMSWGPMQFVLQIAPVPAQAWTRILAVAAAIIVVSEAHKLVRSRGWR